MGNLYLRNRIPDGSRLCISVEAAEGSETDCFVASARLLKESGKEDIWADEDIHGREKCLTLRSPQGYTWRVRVEFLKAGGAVIHATITKPNGDVFSDPYEFPVTGTKGDIVRATVVAVTQQS